jgi:hypothetical protein
MSEIEVDGEEAGTAMKDVRDINLKELAEGFSKLLSEHLGGKFEVDLSNYAKVPHKVSGVSFGEVQVVDITFRVKDESAFQRPTFQARMEKTRRVLGEQ